MRQSQRDPTVGMEPLCIFYASPLPPAFGRNSPHWQANDFLRLIRSLRSQAIRQKEKESARSARRLPRSARNKIPPTEKRLAPLARRRDGASAPPAVRCLELSWNSSRVSTPRQGYTPASHTATDAAAAFTIQARATLPAAKESAQLRRRLCNQGKNPQP